MNRKLIAGGLLALLYFAFRNMGRHQRRVRRTDGKCSEKQAT